MSNTKQPITPGQQFGRLTTLRIVDKIRGYLVWECRCTCGRTTRVRSSHLRDQTRSCGCLGRELTSTRSRTHGQTKSAEYTIWRQMIYRCHRPRHKAYPLYGGRGITVFAPWHTDFLGWLRVMGPRPTQAHSIDRINNDGNYEPGNVRWATQQQQSWNSRRTRMITHEGETLPIAEWARRLGMSWTGLAGRLDRGWPAGIALMTPSTR